MTRKIYSRQAILWLILMLSAIVIAGCGGATPTDPKTPVTLSGAGTDFAYRSVWFDSNKPDSVFVSRDSGLYGSKDAGKTWEPLDLVDSDTILGACNDLFKKAGVDSLDVLAIHKASDLLLLASIDGYGVMRINIEDLID